MINNIAWQNVFNEQLELFRQRQTGVLQEATSYCLKTSGKRLRPHLIYAAGLDFGAPIEALHHAAIAIELIHTYTLIHDDLPAMDNDDFRRNQPSCHKAFNEAIAILTGDKLQAEAFAVISQENHPYLNSQQQIKMIQLLSQACIDLVKGQAMDLGLEQQAIDATSINTIHLKKTGALFSAALGMAGIAAKINTQELQQIQKAGNHLGVAFQIQDDCKDSEKDQCNYLHWHSEKKAIKDIRHLKQQALDAIAASPRNHHRLQNLIDQILPLAIHTLINE